MYGRLIGGKLELAPEVYVYQDSDGNNQFIPEFDTKDFNVVKEYGYKNLIYNELDSKYDLKETYIEDEENITINYEANNDEEYIKQLKNKISNKSKENLAIYLVNNPLKSYCHNSIDGGYYNCTLEKQTELAGLLLSHSIATTMGIDDMLTWNETEKICEVYTVEQLSQLALEIKTYVKPLISMQQHMEASIREANTQQEIKAINIEFTDEAVSYFRKQFNESLTGN